MLEALERFAPESATWTRPAGGFFILMELPASLDATTLLPRVIDKGVAYVPGQPFFVDGSGAATLRLAFSRETPERIKAGVERMCEVFKEG
jgi:DNA-binding transcriptional MocR family regulator